MTDEEIVAALAEALRQHRWAAQETPTGTRDEDYRPGAPCMDCGEYPGPRHERSDCVRALARSLTPVVRRVAEQRAAEELRAAADDWELRGLWFTANELRARAAALTATPNHGRNAT